MSRLSFGRQKCESARRAGLSFAEKTPAIFRIILGCLLWAGAVHCEPIAPMPSDDHAKWEAIGRVNIAGYNRRGMCSGTLVTPDLVLTAAHCVMRTPRDPFQIKDIIFVAGWNRGSYTATGHPERVTLHPDAFQDGALNPVHDLALLHLKSPLPIRPIPTGAPDFASDFAIVGYLDRRPHILSAGFSCAGRSLDVGLVLDCATRPGNSGGPILSRIMGDWHVVSVVSAGNNKLTIGAMLDNFILP